MNKPIICINIISYNNYNIEHCINGILEQKTTYPYEIRIYDDCSCDEVQKILHSYQKNYPDKIKLFLQKENTFLKPYTKTHTYQLIKNVDTKYFSIIEADDYWCDENKLQIGLDFLESHPEYSGWGHDTLCERIYEKVKVSLMHYDPEIEIKNPITVDSPITFILPCSRIHRTYDFKDKQLWPKDDYIFYYELSKGPMHYHDKIMSVYRYGNGLSSSSKDNRLCSSFAYKTALLLDFKYDDLCMRLQKYYDKACEAPKSRYKFLVLLKMIFGMKLGWKIWFFLTFVPKYGFECLDKNWGFPRKKAKENYEKNKNEQIASLKKSTLSKEEQDFEKNYALYKENKENVDASYKFYNSLKNLINSAEEKKAINEAQKILLKYFEPATVDILLYYAHYRTIFYEKKIKKIKKGRNKITFLYVVSLILNILLISLILLKQYGVI